MMAQSNKTTLSEVSVPAKVILFGEHAVVYPGNHAILWPIWSLTATTITRLHKPHDQYQLVYGEDTKSISFSDLENAFEEFKNMQTYMKVCLLIAHQYVSLTSKPKSLKVEVGLNIPIGGFGSSASVAASIIMAVIEANGLSISKQEWYELVMQAEKFPHGNPSGADASVVTVQKPIIVEKKEDGSVVVQELKSSDVLKSLINETTIFYTGRPHQTTAETVKHVSMQANFETILDMVEENTQAAIKAVQNDTIGEHSWKKYLNTNGILLEKLGVVPHKFRKLLEKARKEGGSLKVSGGGALEGDTCGSIIAFGVDSIYNESTGTNYEKFKIA